MSSFINNFFGQNEKPKRKNQLVESKKKMVPEQPKGSVKYKGYYFVDIKESHKLDKKYDAIFMDSKTGKTKIMSFGDKKVKDYTQHKDKKLLQEYLEKHKNDDNKDLMTTSALNNIILWNKTSLSSAIRDYKERMK